MRATHDLDAELLRFTTSVGTGSGIHLVLDRSPSFFDALEVEGADPAVAAFLADAPGSGETRVVGTGLMTEKQVHLDGSAQPEWIGQLGSARIDPAYRGGTIFARCFTLLHEWNRERRAELFLTTILEDNLAARAVFESGRARIPTYRDVGRLVTSSFAIERREGRVSARRDEGIEVAAADDGDVEAIVDFWREQGPRRQFFPAYTAEQLRSQRGLLRGLDPQHILLARDLRTGAIVGTLGLWDQRPFRRWIVRSVPRSLALARPFWNAWAALRGGMRLPAGGEAMDQRFVATLCVRDDEPEIFTRMFAEARRRLAAGGGAWLSLGLHERDPLLAHARASTHRELFSRLYVVHWDEGTARADALDPELCPYVELGSL